MPEYAQILQLIQTKEIKYIRRFIVEAKCPEIVTTSIMPGSIYLDGKHLKKEITG